MYSIHNMLLMTAKREYVQWLLRGLDSMYFDAEDGYYYTWRMGINKEI